MDSSFNNSSEVSHGSLQKIRQNAGAVKFEASVEDLQQRKDGHAAYLRRGPPPEAEAQQKHHGAQRKISEPLDIYRKVSDANQASRGRKRSDSESKSPTGVYATGPPSPTLRRGSYGHLRRGTMMPSENRKSMVPTGWDIHGRRDSFQSWPSDDRRMTQLLQKPGLLSRLLQTRHPDNLSGSLRSSDNMHYRRIKLENTYKTEPDDRFEAHIVKQIIEKVFKKYLETQQYDAPLMGQKSRTLADIIKEKVKSLQYDRYKIISWVVIVQKGCNDIRIASKCVWDKDNDTFAEASYENGSLHAFGVCYGVYQE